MPLEPTENLPAIPDELYLSSFECGDITIRFPWDRKTGRIGLEVLPSMLLDQVALRRPTLSGLSYIDVIPGAGEQVAYVVDSLVQFKILGDAYSGGFAQGQTMRNSVSVESLFYDGQEIAREGEQVTITTRLRNSRNHRAEHVLSWHDGDDFFRVFTRFFNDSTSIVRLEMLSSFCLGGITPFHGEDAPNRLHVHRFRSGWSAEGRLESRTVEQLHLERSWSGHAMFSERFGQVGSMPVRKWFPFVAIEDSGAGVLWGASLAWGGSWQMEVFRQHDNLSISGGLADREFGQWMKVLEPGESIVTPKATMACVRGSLDELCDRLTRSQQRAADTHPIIEHDLPIIFNEWCTTYGNPQHNMIVRIADQLKSTKCKYLVVDAGWYKQEDVDWSQGHGDWVPNPRLFPEGLAATAAAIRERGLIPGLWFEIETVGSQSAAFSLLDHLLHRDGIPLTSGARRFWDMNDPRVVDILTKKVIDFLERCEFGYLKVDYNESVGIGSDDRNSLGEGLRRHVEGTYRFFERIRERLPDLVIENCSSGGHRLEPSFLGLTAMSSFSDAHETVEIPIIAANLHRLILPRQNQVWAVLRRSDDLKRITYSIAATFLGRMCISGEITELTGSQWNILLQAQQLYQRAIGIIKEGVSRRFGTISSSWRHPNGWQAILRRSMDGQECLVIVHAFADAPKSVRVPLSPGDWEVVGSLPNSEGKVCESHLGINIEGDFSASVHLLKKVGLN